VEDDSLEIRLNGRLIATITQVAEGGTTTLTPDAKQFRTGGNELSFRAIERGPTADQPISVESVDLHVDYVSA
jgi:hypothetical protein